VTISSADIAPVCAGLKTGLKYFRGMEKDLDLNEIYLLACT
jgi:hypothetical protein